MENDGAYMKYKINTKRKPTRYRVGGVYMNGAGTGKASV